MTAGYTCGKGRIVLKRHHRLPVEPKQPILRAKPDKPGGIVGDGCYVLPHKLTLLHPADQIVILTGKAILNLQSNQYEQGKAANTHGFHLMNCYKILPKFYPKL